MMVSPDDTSWLMRKFGESHCILQKFRLMPNQSSRPGDVVKMSVFLNGNGELANPKTEITISCRIWLNTRFANRGWKKVKNGYIRQLMATYKDGKLFKRDREIKMLNNNDVVKRIQTALSKT
jgi:hypothetical protein